MVQGGFPGKYSFAVVVCDVIRLICMIFRSCRVQLDAALVLVQDIVLEV